jgi:hypothetical protein
VTAQVRWPGSGDMGSRDMGRTDHILGYFPHLRAADPFLVYFYSLA